jgi:hypothetical protein
LDAVFVLANLGEFGRVELDLVLEVEEAARRKRKVALVRASFLEEAREGSGRKTSTHSLPLSSTSLPIFSHLSLRSSTSALNLLPSPSQLTLCSLNPANFSLKSAI